MFRQTVLSLACFALLPLAHAADHEIDPAFGLSLSGWYRMHADFLTTNDEKAVAFARTADGGYVVALEGPGGAANGGTGKRIGLARLYDNGIYVYHGWQTYGVMWKDAFLTSVTDMTIDAQGRIIVVGATPGPGGLSNFGVVRFTANGFDDTSFAGDGGTSFGFDQPGVDVADAPTSVLTDPDGRIVVAGNYTASSGSVHKFSVVRFNTDGSVDTSFGLEPDGSGGNYGTVSSFKDGQHAYASRILRIADGYYVITGTSVYSSTDTDFAARILVPFGAALVDPASSDTFPIDEPGPGGSLYDGVNDAILVDPTTILLVGTASGKFAATRIKVGTAAAPGAYTTLGLDPSFVGSAIPGRPNLYVGNTQDSACESAAISSDGRMMLVGGTSSPSFTSLTLEAPSEPNGSTFAYLGLVTRLKRDGSLDTGFGLGGSYPYAAPASGGSPSYYTGFKQVRFDGTQPVIIGSSVDSTSNVSNFDAVITRLQSDVIFANGFE